MTTATAERERAFMPQLDGLRAFAVTAVLVHHLLAPDIVGALPFGMTWGLFGVRLFFVLSGFLITGLLLKDSDAAWRITIPQTQVLQQFYLRRTLRIFPLYYFVLGLAWIFGGAGVREDLPSLASYTYNFRVAALGWFTAHFSHFWSLCVEEQFYLFWPWVVLFCPRQRLLPATLLMIALGPLFRLFAVAMELGPVAFFALTPSSFDALGLGALLAIAVHERLRRIEWMIRYCALPVGLIGSLVIALEPRLDAILRETMIALVFVALVAAAARGFRGPGRWVLEARPVLHLGKISYGIYVYHLLIPPVVGPMLVAFGVKLAPGGAIEFLVYALATVAVASLSWTLMERPINKFKRRFAMAPAAA